MSLNFPNNDQNKSYPEQQDVREEFRNSISSRKNEWKKLLGAGVVGSEPIGASWIGQEELNFLTKVFKKANMHHILVFKSIPFREVDRKKIPSRFFSNKFYRYVSTISKDGNEAEIYKAVENLELSHAVFHFLSDIAEETGGKAIIRADFDFIDCIWYSPDDLDVQDWARIAYMSFLVKVGLKHNLLQEISSEVYGGAGVSLAAEILAMRFVNEEASLTAHAASAELLKVMPMSYCSWAVAGALCLFKQEYLMAFTCFYKAYEMNVLSIASLTSLTVIASHIPDYKAAAFDFSEKAVNLEGLIDDGSVGVRTRVFHSFALKSSNMRILGNAQIKLAFPDMKVSEVKMTPTQWKDFGYQIPEEMLKEALKNPLEYKQYASEWTVVSELLSEMARVKF